MNGNTEIDIEKLCYDDFDATLDTEKINILKDLPYAMQIDRDSIKNTFINLYKYFKYVEPVNKIPEPFYSDWIIRCCEIEFETELTDEEMDKILK